MNYKTIDFIFKLSIVFQSFFVLRLEIVNIINIHLACITICMGSRSLPYNGIFFYNIFTYLDNGIVDILHIIAITNTITDAYFTNSIYITKRILHMC